ncbi:putative tRNA pseudouridine synthase D [Candidatus Lokiarchaeum ossiferum]|uniref:Probable tRNA pseudouridine synthase D n=1 Tax=Candidatus Lokiarchaeum ossiferum TaxID=2951803 RepID=A0ABY6HXL2_9ARCH|nr:putative tRNA pseudouridine synthase D [Candidatus Lokiarchaeum sp. B-35]
METSHQDINEKQRKRCGISGYTTSTTPINGILKSEISDFIVREITLSGEILSTHEKEMANTHFNPRRDKATIFTVIKKKMDTILASKTLAEYLHVPPNHIKWAGIKDHTAITAQRFTVRGNRMNDLKNFKHNNITITNIRPAKEEIELGKLWGNNFTINLRNIHEEYQEIEGTLAEWTEQINTYGFPNYFGMQRFGQHRPNSHKVGRYAFLGQFKEACEEFLYQIYPKEYEENKQFREKLRETSNLSEVLKNWPRGFHYEKLIVNKLVQNQEDFQSAFFALPTPLVNLVMSSFQSYIFNQAISKRISQGHPLSQPISGDLVSILMEPKGHPSLITYKYEGGKGWNDATILKAFKHERATIIAPILGHKTKLTDYPAFEPIYKNILEEENFEMNQFNHQYSRIFSFDGTFRPIFNKPSSLKISQAYITNKYPELDPHGIKLEFSLPKGTYATVLLRELRKYKK